jgi:NADPH:quinone reductase-like Zn-dependent oxidoreductase
MLTAPQPGEVRVRALFGALSRGTEALVLAGRVPESEFERMRAPFMGGRFPFPVKYGYATVGQIEEGPEKHLGRTVFALHPAPAALQHSRKCHCDIASGSAAAASCVGRQYGDGPQCGVGCGGRARDRVAIVGAGAVGALVAFLCSRLMGVEATLVDINEKRAELAQRLGVRFAKPETARDDCDVVFHASGSAAGLGTALSLAGDEATVLELSWYGDAPVTVPLGGAFHSRRLRLISSQVGRIAVSHRSRWTHNRRLAAAVALLADPCLDALLAPEVGFSDLPRRLSDILDARNGVVCQLISYP